MRSDCQGLLAVMYCNFRPSCAPADYCTKQKAKRAIAHAQEIVSLCEISRFDKEAVVKAPGYSLANCGKNTQDRECATFGSFPKGERVPGSGIDLLLIPRESSIPLPDSSGGVYLRLLGGDEPRPYNRHPGQMKKILSTKYEILNKRKEKFNSSHQSSNDQNMMVFSLGH